MIISLDRFHDQCGICGVFGHAEAANLVYLGLYALQHRGQESAGIVSSDGEHLYSARGMGLVADVFTEEALRSLPGNMAIGHNRYSTTGESHLKNVQPLMVSYALGSLALSHNGNLVNSQIIKAQLEAYGSIFQSTNDSEVIIHLIALSKNRTLIDRAIDALNQVKGSYSLLLLTEKEMIGVRDPYGFRPLCLGKLGSAYVLASETCALDLIEADFIREIEPGEIVIIDKEGIRSIHPFSIRRSAFCIFEYIYFSRPDSYIFGSNIHTIRKKFGQRLAKETWVDADLVVPVPDSGVPAALGYAEGSGIPYETALIRNHYVGRTFIEPQQSIRHFGVKIKLNPVREALKGKRVVVVDDSIVRGTTSRKIVKMIRNAGAKEVHLRISSPPILYPCFYGIDTPTRQELIASSHTIEEIRKYVTADSLAYLSIEGMLDVVSGEKSEPVGSVQRNKFCVACFNGNYPIPFTKEEEIQLGLF